MQPSLPRITFDPSLEPNRQYKIDHAGKIPKQSFQVLVGFFTALSTLAAIMRITFRLITRRKLYLDDWLVIFATASFLSATGVLFSYQDKVYLGEALMRSVDVAFTPMELLSIVDIMKWNDIFLCLAWTANFAIKFSFLAFFHSLIRDVSRTLCRYYWFVVVYTGLSWAFVIVEPFILCPSMEMSERTTCPDHTLNVVLVTFLFVFDITTDIMIASIPIVLLRMSFLHPIQKIRIGTFLCLSLVIVIVSLVRLVGGLYHSRRGRYEFSMQWTFIILHIEAAIAILMGSISALRTVFAKQSGRDSQEEKGPIVFIYQKFLRMTGSSKGWDDSKSKEDGAPKISDPNITQPTMKGLRSFIRRHERSQGHTTMASTMSDVEDYHEFMKKEKSGNGNSDEVRLQTASSSSNTTNKLRPTSTDDDPWITTPDSFSHAA